VPAAVIPPSAAGALWPVIDAAEPWNRLGTSEEAPQGDDGEASGTLTMIDLITSATIVSCRAGPISQDLRK
jgi:hypothetical protein